MSKRDEMNKIDRPIIPSSPGKYVAPKDAFISPFKGGDEVIYVEQEAKDTLYSVIPEKTCKATYLGYSYVDDGNDALPRAILQKNDLKRETLRVPFNRVRAVG